MKTMKKIIIVALGLLAITIFAVSLLPCNSSYADNTTVTVVVGSPNDVNANLGVTTPGTATVNVGVDGGAGSSVNVNGVAVNQVNINSQNVATTMDNVGKLVQDGQRGADFNQQNYLFWIKPTWNKVDALQQATTDMAGNLDLTMTGLAKAIVILQEQNDELKSQQRSLSQLADNLSRTVSERQKQQAILTEQFGYIDSQFQKSIDRDNTTLEMMRTMNNGILSQIADHDTRLQILANNYVAEGLANEQVNKEITNKVDSLNGTIVGLMVALGVVVVGFILSLLLVPHGMTAPKQ